MSSFIDTSKLAKTQKRLNAQKKVYMKTHAGDEPAESDGKKRGERSHGFSIVINNDTYNDLAKLINYNYRYLIFGFEHHSDDDQTPHIQGYMQTYDKMTITTLIKRIMGKSPNRSHLEVAIADEYHNQFYCMKEHDYYEFGVSVTQGTRTDIDVATERVLAGEPMLSVFEKHRPLWVQYRRSFDALKDMVDAEKKHKCVFLKYTSIVDIMDLHPNAFIFPEYITDYNDYNGQKTIAFEGSVPSSFVKIYRHTGRYKISGKWCQAEVVYIKPTFMPMDEDYDGFIPITDTEYIGARIRQQKRDIDPDYDPEPLSDGDDDTDIMIEYMSKEDYKRYVDPDYDEVENALISREDLAVADSDNDFLDTDDVPCEQCKKIISRRRAILGSLDESPVYFCSAECDKRNAQCYW